MNSYTATAVDYTNVLTNHLPFKLTVYKVFTPNSSYLSVHTDAGAAHFDYFTDFYSLTTHIIYYFQSNHPELFI